MDKDKLTSQSRRKLLKTSAVGLLGGSLLGTGSSLASQGPEYKGVFYDPKTFELQSTDVVASFSTNEDILSGNIKSGKGRIPLGQITREKRQLRGKRPDIEFFKQMVSSGDQDYLVKILSTHKGSHTGYLLDTSTLEKTAFMFPHPGGKRGVSDAVAELKKMEEGRQ